VPVAFQWVLRDIIAASGVDTAGVDKMLMQVIDKFEDIPLHGAGDRDVVNQARKGSEYIPKMETPTYLKCITY